MQLEDVIRAVNALDLKTFSLENVEILQRMLPTDAEVRSSQASFEMITLLNAVPSNLGKSLSRLRHIEEKHRFVNGRRPIYLSSQSHGTFSNETSSHVLYGQLFR